MKKIVLTLIMLSILTTVSVQAMDIKESVSGAIRDAAIATGPGTIIYNNATSKPVLIKHYPSFDQKNYITYSVQPDEFVIAKEGLLPVGYATFPDGIKTRIPFYSRKQWQLPDRAFVVTFTEEEKQGVLDVLRGKTHYEYDLNIKMLKV